MKLKIILVADCANMTGNGKINVMGIFHIVNSPVFPVRHPSMHFVAMLLPELGEMGERQLSIQFYNPDNELLLELSRPIKIPPIQNGVRPEINVVFELRDIVFASAGDYEFALLINGEKMGDCTITVQSGPS
jgi:hypothetical protein